MRALLEGLRPRQWTKNLLLFAGLVFSQQLGQPALVLRACGGFLAFSLLSGAVYLLNDLLDVESDRQHARKRLRPIASGRLPAATAWAALPVVLVLAGALSWWLGTGFALVLLVYLVNNVLYSFVLKRVVVLDVMLIALGFMLRAMAGVELLLPVAPSTELSMWLLVCTFFGALFLGVSKRRRELVNAGEQAPGQRAVLRAYTPELLDVMLAVSASLTVMAYALYTMWPTTVAKFHTELLIITVPFVAFGVFRHLVLVRVSETSEDPSMVLLTDRPTQLNLACFLASALWVLYSHR